MENRNHKGRENTKGVNQNPRSKIIATLKQGHMFPDHSDDREARININRFL